MYRLTTEKSGILGYGGMENVSFSLPFQGTFGQFCSVRMRPICHDIANSLNMFLNSVMFAPDKLLFALQIQFIIFVPIVTKKLRMFRMFNR